MLSVDTNVLVRLLIADHPEQLAAAQAIFAARSIWIGRTVMLETEWVLRSNYGMDRDSRVAVLQGVLGLANTEVEDRSSVQEALNLVLQGLDFADALHLCCRAADTTFLSFDRALVRRAQRAGIASVQDASSWLPR
jgi:predicted nucleic-acid-binding protein